jgi:hypothetical protein
MRLRSSRAARRHTPLHWLSAIICGGLLGLMLRLVLFVTAALVTRLAGELSLSVARLSPSLDPVYTHAALRSLTDLHLQGVAVAGSAGDWLHGVLPQLFVDPARARWGLARVVVEPGSPVLARLVAAGLAHAGVLAAGLLVVRRGWRRHQPLVMTAGFAMQLPVAIGILGAQPSVRELEATGVSFAVNALAPWLGLRGTALTDALSQAWPPLMAALLVGIALVIGYLPCGAVLLLRDRARRITVASSAAVILSSALCAGVLLQEVSAASPTMAPLPTAAAAAPAPIADMPESLPAIAAVARAPLTSERWFAELHEAAGPTHVEITGGDYQYQYVVDGVPQVIKGMGLNTQYTYQLTPQERAVQLDADMAALSQLGVNTVLGWDPAEFDSALLDAAQRYRIGVVMPFDLDPEADYTDPQVRQRLSLEVLAWVSRYQNHPALRMWGLGNEVLHKIVHPAWVGPQDARREAQAQAFSEWLIETADAIHALDPNHPVTYRSAEDAFVGWVAAALQRRGGGPRPWFVWGTNCYQKYLADIVDRWTEAGFPAALWVSEFAPGGMAVPDRPDGFATMWSIVRRHPEWVLGGAVYTWTRNGPEGVDRTFGLTDDGVPVDGRSLDMLQVLFHTD